MNELEDLKFEPANVNTEGWDFLTADGVFIKQMLLPNAGLYIPQHSHEYEHNSMVAKGAIRVWCDGELMGDYHAPTAVLIKPRCKHTFMSLEPETVVYCIHNVSRTGEVEIAEEHHLVGGT